MRSMPLVRSLVGGLLFVCPACQSRNGGPAADPASPSRSETHNAKAGRTTEVAQPKHAGVPSLEPAMGAGTARRPFTAENNPTTLGGRGVPDLNDQNRPAAWIFIDGHDGRFIEKDGQRLLQWITTGEVSAAPTFRVEVYEPLFGLPRDFRCVLQTDKADDGSVISYAIRAEDGAFQTGKEYSLLEPGPGFVILNAQTRDPVNRIPPLAPGVYGLVGRVTNADTGQEGLAVTYFTVGGA